MFFFICIWLMSVIKQRGNQQQTASLVSTNLATLISVHSMNWMRLLFNAATHVINFFSIKYIGIYTYLLSASFLSINSKKFIDGAKILKRCFYNILFSDNICGVINFIIWASTQWTIIHFIFVLINTLFIGLLLNSLAFHSWMWHLIKVLFLSCNLYSQIKQFLFVCGF